MKRRFTIVAATLALLAIFIAPMGMMGQTRAEEVYKSSLFGPDYNSQGVSSYTGNNWYSTTNGFRLDIVNANNNNNQWNLIKIGGKNGAYTGKLTTHDVIDEPVTKVVLTIDAITTGNVTSMKLYSSSNNSSWTEIGTFSKSTGAQAVAINTPTANLYYKIEVVCTKANNNGVVTISKVEYYHNAGASTPTHAYTLNVTGDDEEAEASLYVNGEELGANDEIAEGETVTVSVMPSDGYAYSVSVKDANNVAVEYDDEMDSFTMPTSAVTITVTTTLIPTYTVTFNTNGGTFVGNNDFPQQSNTKEAGTYTLPSATKEGFTFGGWLATGNANAVTGNYEVSGNVDFTAQWIPGVTDVLNLAFTGVTGTSYTDWSGKEGASGAVYAGQSAGRYNAIQLRATSPSGIVTTTSGGAVKKVTVTWESNTIADRVLNVYGKNTAYSAATDLYGNNAGTLLGTIVCGSSTELVISGDYAYIGLRSADNAMYLTQIEITWGSASAVAAPTFEPGTGTTFHGTQQITITAEEGAAVRYTTDGTEPTATTGMVYNGPFSIDATTTVKAVAYATIEGETETSAVAEAVYTRLYYITLTQPFHGSISCDAEAAAGTQVTVTATPDVNYQFGTLTVTPNATVSNNTFTMPAADVNVTATFVASNTYTVSFSINGKIEMTATTTGSIDVDNFIADVTTEGKRFKGWYDNDTRVSGNYNPGMDKTLVAVFEDASSAYALVTSTDQLVAGNYVVIAASAYGEAMSTEQKSNNRGECDIEKQNSTISWNASVTYPVCEFELGGNASGWTFYDDVNSGYIYAAGTATSNRNYLRTEAQLDDNDWGLWTITIGSSNKATIESVGNGNTPYLKYNTGGMFACYSSDSQSDVVLYTKSASKAMRDGEVEATSVVAEVAANVLVTVKANGIVYLTGSNAGNSSNLVVEDGGQLVTSANVAGTMQKDVTGYGNNTNASNYYLITAPSTINPQNVEYMLNTNGYDLYYFNQSAVDDVEGEDVLLEWRNYKDESFNLEAGTGYLYANKENKTLNLAGTLAKNDNNEPFAQNITYVDGYRFSGWNLVGNPFPSNASVNMPFYKMKSSRDGINGTAVVSGSVIAPMEGVFVIAANSNAQQQVTFTATTDPVGSPAKNNVNIDVNRDNEFLDRAIVNFNGCTLSKLNLSENTTKVYFQQGQEEFAIVSVESEGELPVNFKASRNGRYTMSVDIEDLDMNYLHLIDNKTGMDVDLLQTPSYTFQASTGDNAYRFRLVFDANSVQENNTTANFAYFNGSEWVVNNPSTGSGDNATLQVIDMMGRVLSSETLNGNTTVTLNQVPGVYMFRLVNGNDVKVQKVVVR